MNNWIAWSGMLTEHGPLKFYSLPGWTDYTPGFFYYLWIAGSFFKAIGASLTPFWVKLPIILADMGTGLLLYKILFKKSFKIAAFAFLAYVLNPVVMFTNSVWGQTDGLIALLILLSAYFLAEKGSYIFSSLFWVFALFVKPQALSALPILLLYLIFKKKYKQTAFFVLLASVFIVILGLPFFANTNPIFGIPILISKMSNESPFTSVMAFNFWAFIKGMWIPDSGTFLGLTYTIWGAVIFLAAFIWVALGLAKSKLKPQHLYFSLGLVYLAFFLFPTRIHERYILVSLPFFLLSASLVFSKFEFILYFLLSFLSLINIYHPYAYYTKESFLSSTGLLSLTTSSYKFISFLFVLMFFFYSFKDRLSKYFNFDLSFIKNLKMPGKVKFTLPASTLSPELIKYLLIAVISFSFLARVAWLGSPKNEYFDEVYHAFKARQILNGNKMAWEWWNTPPEGFAYEWTHPPLAKLGMVLGMLVFGENAFGWRIVQAILGVGTVFLIYLISKELFKDKLLSLLSATVFSLDGLPLVMSRIGMNDTYMLFFMLLSLYFFLREKDFWSALTFGLSLASKWSVIWIIPLYFLLWLKRREKFRPSIIWFLVIPPAVYLLTYLPMFLTGHGLNIWWEMQKQMWWYHTRLKATHPYTSHWWSWPLLIRPIYLYTSNEVNGMVSRIYAFGNPFVFWFGLISVFLSGIYAFYERNKKLALVIFAYLIFFVPWAASPRIMFLYHYLPSIPFLAIATGYVLRRNLKLAIWYLFICLLVFIYYYPHWAGLNIPLWLDTSYYWFSSWR
ncbi:MAG: glycosyltransferase family 39 protein [Candidatus Woesebacteria bacterium]|nr:glycosyltransferase family 39 protein [Candidatus Woesebacteria bacterium]